ncbi:MAG TPA: Calx-beta domain-containing protein [Wenzhouxiangellaceae bacterium]|nr:Calx-beta domain-containing protein [Wenzhouxiangellaceae bacterium]
MADEWQMTGTDTTVSTGDTILRPAEILANAGGSNDLLTLAEDFSGERDGIGITGFAADRLTGNHAYFAMDRATAAARLGDVVRCPLDGGACTLEFIAETAGVPEGIGVSAVGLEQTGGLQQLLLSFDTSFELAGQIYRPADLARFDGAVLSMALSHAETGAEPFWNLTAASSRPNGGWQLAYGNGGAIGALQFFTSDVLDAGAAGSVTGRVARLRDNSPGWQAAGITAWDQLDTGRAQFTDLPSSINPGETEVVLTVERTGGAEGRIEIDYATIDGSAAAGTDYLATTGTLVWEHLESGTRDIAVTILDNQGIPGDRDFELRLSRASPWSLLGSLSALTLTLPNADTLFRDEFEGPAG